MGEYYINKFNCYGRKELLKQIDKEHEQKQKLIEALEEIACGELPDGDMPSQPVVMFAQQTLDEVGEK